MKSIFSILFSFALLQASLAQASQQQNAMAADGMSGGTMVATRGGDSSEVQMESYAAAKEKPVSILDKVSGTFAAESYSKYQDTNSGKGNPETDFSAAATVKLNDNTSLKGYAEWDHKYGTNQDKKPSNLEYTEFQDPYIGLTRTGVINTDSGLRLDTQARVYAPIGWASRQSDQIFQIRLYGVLSKPLTKALKATLSVSPRFFAQNNDYYRSHENKIFGTDKFRLESYAGLKYSFNDKWSVEQTLGVYQMWFNGTPGTTVTTDGLTARVTTSHSHSDYLMTSSFIGYAPSKTLYLQAGIRQSKYGTDLRSSHVSGPAAGSNNIYAPAQSEYFFNAYLSI